MHVDIKYEKQLENDVHLRFGVGCRLAEICLLIQKQRCCSLVLVSNNLLEAFFSMWLLSGCCWFLVYTLCSLPIFLYLQNREIDIDESPWKILSFLRKLSENMGEKNGIPLKKQYKMGPLLSPVVWSPRRAARLVSKHTKFGITTRRTISRGILASMIGFQAIKIPFLK